MILRCLPCKMLTCLHTMTPRTSFLQPTLLIGSIHMFCMTIPTPWTFSRIWTGQYNSTWTTCRNDTELYLQDNITSYFRIRYHAPKMLCVSQRIVFIVFSPELGRFV